MHRGDIFRGRCLVIFHINYGRSHSIFNIFITAILANAGLIVFITKYTIEILPILILLLSLGIKSKIDNFLLLIYILILLASFYTPFYPSKTFRNEGNKLVADITDDKVLTLEPHLKIFDGYKGIDNTEMKNKYVFDTNEEAFDCAVASMKKVLINNGYKEVDGKFVK